MEFAVINKTTPSQDLKTARRLASQAKRKARLISDPTCSKCGKTKTIADFPENDVCYWCQECRSANALRRYHERRKKLPSTELSKLKGKINKRQNKRRANVIATMAPDELEAFRDRMNSLNRRKHQEARNAVFEAYGGYKCKCCGVTEPAFLSIDHINNDGAEHKREYRLRTSTEVYRWLIKNNYPTGFQVLCMNCQWGKRVHGVCPHQVRCND